MKHAPPSEIVLGLLLIWSVAGCHALLSLPTSAPPSAPAPTVIVIAAQGATLTLPNATPTSTRKNYPPYYTPEFIASPTPPAVTYTTHDTLREYPLLLGAMWVYSLTEYTTIEGGGLVTTTWRVTDTVATVETRNSMHAAYVVRSTALISATQDFSTLPNGDSYFNNMQNPQSKWLIVDGNKILEQTDLDWDHLEQAGLELIFPLARDNRWYPDPEQRALFSPYGDLAYRVPGFRWLLKLEMVRVPFGRFEDCFAIEWVWNGGSVFDWFCPGIGIVAEQFDHAGTPFGYRSELIRFTRGR